MVALALRLHLLLGRLLSGALLGLGCLRTQHLRGLLLGVLVGKDHLAGPGGKFAVQGIGIQYTGLGGAYAGEQKAGGGHKERVMFHMRL